MDWTKHASKANKVKKQKPKRIALSIKPELEQAIEVFKSHHPEVTKDTAVLMTMIEAGFKQWADYIRSVGQNQSTEEDQENE